MFRNSLGLESYASYIRYKWDTSARKKGAEEGDFVWQIAVADTKVPLFEDNFLHFQIKIKFQPSVM